jgi:hypothetical protein
VLVKKKKYVSANKEQNTGASQQNSAYNFSLYGVNPSVGDVLQILSAKKEMVEQNM